MTQVIATFPGGVRYSDCAVRCSGDPFHLEYSAGRRLAWYPLLPHPRLEETGRSKGLRYYSRQECYVFAFVCLSVCLSVCPQDNSKSCWRVLMKFLAEVKCVILCSHYATVSVWQTVCSTSLLFSRTFSRTYHTCLIRATERETVGQTVCQTVA